jgi:hypothetical protein
MMFINLQNLRRQPHLPASWLAGDKGRFELIARFNQNCAWFVGGKEFVNILTMTGSNVVRAGASSLFAIPAP